MVHSQRLEGARRLELTDAVEVGERIEGRFSGLEVALIERGDQRALAMVLDVTVQWVSIGPRIREINDPDEVVTGDDAFDRQILVLAEDGCAPAVTEVFKLAPIRERLLDFLRRFPLAELRGRTLNVPHAASETAQVLKDASRLMLALRAAITTAPPTPTEAPPQLPRNPLRAAVAFSFALLALTSLLWLPAWTIVPVAGVGAALWFLLFRDAP